MRLFALLAAGLLSVPPASAGQVVSPRPDSVSVTVYHVEKAGRDRWDPLKFRTLDPEGGLALITETRTIDVPAGPAVIELRGVASTIVPQTAQIDGLPVGVLEQNFDYDLLSPGSLLAKSVGSSVRLVRTSRATGKEAEQRAIVRSAPNGTVLDIDGHIEALGCSGLAERLVFDKVPEGLRDTPTLSIRTDAPQGGRYVIRLSYIAVGINWAADYVARIRPDGKSLDLNAWVTVMNMGDTGFERAPLMVVAGKPETSGDDTPVATRPVEANTKCWPTNIRWSRDIEMLLRSFPPPPPPPPPAPMSALSLEAVTVTGFRAAEELGDLKLYRMNQPTDMLARQTKQVQLLDLQNVPFKRIYVFDANEQTYGRGDSGEAPARAVLRLQNTKAGGIGVPLPAGTVSVSETDGERPPVLIGRDAIDDLSVGLPAEIALGSAMDVRVSWTTVDRSSVRGRKTGEIVISNTKKVPVEFELRIAGIEGIRIVSESRSHATTPKGYVWALSLGPGERQTLRIAIETDS